MLEPPRRGGSNKYPQSMFWSKNKKNRYTPAYPIFAIYKWGSRGYILHGHVFLMLFQYPPSQYPQGPPQQVYYPQQPQTVVAQGAFDSGARFDGTAQPRIPVCMINFY